MYVRVGETLDLEWCPHCLVNTPLLEHIWEHREKNGLFWAVYRCSRCRRLVLAGAPEKGAFADLLFPSTGSGESDESIPAKAQRFLTEARETRHAPSASIMVCASAVDAMLKQKAYVDGSLYSRIDKAADDGLLTDEMKNWAHQVRLDANDQRHADVAAALPTEDDAKRCYEFALTLAQLLFVLPARVTRGIQQTKQSAGAST